jgi:hypothetical protein
MIKITARPATPHSWLGTLLGVTLTSALAHQSRIDSDDRLQCRSDAVGAVQAGYFFYRADKE